MFNENIVDEIVMKDNATKKSLEIIKQLYPNAKIIYKGVDISENSKEKTT